MAGLQESGKGARHRKLSLDPAGSLLPACLCLSGAAALPGDQKKGPPPGDPVAGLAIGTGSGRCSALQLQSRMPRLVDHEPMWS